AGLQVEEVPVLWAHSEGTRLHPFRDGIKMFVEVLRVRWYAMAGDYAASAVPSAGKLLLTFHRPLPPPVVRPFTYEAVAADADAAKRTNSAICAPISSVETVRSSVRARSRVRKPPLKIAVTPASTHSASLGK